MTNETATKMETYKVKRDGKRDLRFVGQRVAYATSQTHRGDTQNRWDEYTLYRTATGKFVLQMEYFTCWQGESGSDRAVVCDSEQEVILALESVDPCNGESFLLDLAKELLEEAGIDCAEEL